MPCFGRLWQLFVQQNVQRQEFCATGFPAPSASPVSELLAQEVPQDLWCNIEGRGLETRYTITKIKQAHCSSLFQHAEGADDGYSPLLG